MPKYRGKWSGNGQGMVGPRGNLILQGKGWELDQNPGELHGDLTNTLGTGR